jgi:hypothetical protein
VIRLIKLANKFDKKANKDLDILNKLETAKDVDDLSEDIENLYESYLNSIDDKDDSKQEREKFFSSQPLFSKLKEHDPHLYEQALKEFDKSVRMKHDKTFAPKDDNDFMNKVLKNEENESMKRERRIFFRDLKKYVLQLQDNIDESEVDVDPDDLSGAFKKVILRMYHDGGLDNKTFKLSMRPGEIFKDDDYVEDNSVQVYKFMTFVNDNVSDIYEISVKL